MLVWPPNGAGHHRPFLWAELDHWQLLSVARAAVVLLLLVDVLMKGAHQVKGRWPSGQVAGEKWPEMIVH